MNRILSFNFSKLLFWLALAGLFIMLGVTLYGYARLAQTALAFPYPIDYGEGPLLDQTLRLADGENIYHSDFSVPPYTISNYPPLFLLVQVPFSALFGPAFWYGRAISLVCALLTAFCIGLSLFTLTGDWAASVVGGLVFLAFPYTQFWSLLNRIDLLALALSWAALLVIFRWHNRSWGIGLGAGLLVAAIYTRQSYALAAPLAAFTWLLAKRQPRSALRLALITGSAGLVLFLLMNIVTGGGFYQNIVTANVNPFYWRNVKVAIDEITGRIYLLLLISVVFLVGERWGKHTLSWPAALPYLIGATLSALTIGKDGSNVNYLLEFAAAIAFLVGACLAWAGGNRWVGILVIAVLAFQIQMMTSWAREKYDMRITYRTRQAEQVAELARLVREADGVVLADEFMGLVPLAGKRLAYQPFEYKMLAEGGVWDEEPFLESIRGRDYALIIMFQPPDWPAIKNRWTPAMIRAVEENYALDDTAAFTRILLPR